MLNCGECFSRNAVIGCVIHNFTVSFCFLIMLLCLGLKDGEHALCRAELQNNKSVMVNHKHMCPFCIPFHSCVRAYSICGDQFRIWQFFMHSIRESESERQFH